MPLEFLMAPSVLDRVYRSRITVLPSGLSGSGGLGDNSLTEVLAGFTAKS